eukprot:TRINITY_DN343_c0_g1_i2.p1 TRINITY_DN343_c0_g1~~TRINITY_DN343_c0_g1_i2.p1  ORF type:complete len:502 (-),score=145.29 TRINITY_DN343_c0_g1_i2:209-1645(-)
MELDDFVSPFARDTHRAVSNFNCYSSSSQDIENDREFSLDLSPSVLLASGSMVSTLVRSSLSHYIDFCLVDSLLVWSDEKDDLIKVPSSKSDIFSSSDISIVEKRLLMRFLQTASSIEISKELESKTFEKELKEKFKFTTKLMNFVMFAMAMCQTDEEASSLRCSDGYSRVQTLLNSMGRYGPNPFLYSFYGTGEYSQAFCRSAAVFGATFILREEVKTENMSIVHKENEDRHLHVPSGIGEIKTRCIVLPNQGKFGGPKRIIVLSKKQLLAEVDCCISIFPPNSFGNKRTIFALQAGWKASVTPSATYVVHFIVSKEEDCDVSDSIIAWIEGKDDNVAYAEFESSLPSIGVPDLECESESGIFYVERSASLCHGLEEMHDGAKNAFENVVRFLGIIGDENENGKPVFLGKRKTPYGDDDVIRDEEAELLEIERVPVVENDENESACEDDEDCNATKTGDDREQVAVEEKEEKEKDNA